jgi:hypothetical protein
MSQRSNRPQWSKPLVKKKRSQKQKSPELVLKPAFPGQVVKQMKFEGTPILLTTTVTSGLIASSTIFGFAQIPNWATRVGVLFEEYRIVKVKAILRCFSTSNPGLFTHWIDEKDPAAPTLAEANQKSTKQFQIASIPPRSIAWTAHSPEDLGFKDITVDYNPATYKIYTNAANFGSSIVATNVAQVTFQYVIQFRGLN